MGQVKISTPMVDLAGHASPHNVSPWRRSPGDSLNGVEYWRISKYDPQFRDQSGRYLRDEWIGAAQIGKAFGGETLTTDEYLRVERLYVAAVLHLWKASGAPSLQIQALQPSPAAF